MTNQDIKFKIKIKILKLIVKLCDLKKKFSRILPFLLQFDISVTALPLMKYSGFRGRRRIARSVFDGFRDFQAEASKYLESFKYTGPLLL